METNEERNRRAAWSVRAANNFFNLALLALLGYALYKSFGGSL